MIPHTRAVPAAYRCAMPPLILTAELDPASFDHYDALRQAHFPVRDYALPAHLTLFHKLPGAEEPRIAGLLARTAARCPPLPLLFSELISMGRGCAVRVRSPGLMALRAALAAGWSDRMTDQDKAWSHPHVTIQNKAGPADARHTYETLLGRFRANEGTCTGLLLWRYMGGPWEEASRHPFRGKT